MPLKKFVTEGCSQQVKDKNFESNSQPHPSAASPSDSCSQQVKDKNFESNSQLAHREKKSKKVVLSRSKIKISKAIHNGDL